jgi:menaquinone-dependent protoporphyrinogen IX oxidase
MGQRTLKTYIFFGGVMKIIVIYNSKTGFTKKYADWIAEELSCSVLPYGDLSKTDVNADDIVIFGSRVHVGKIEHLNRIKAFFGNQQKLIVFATGGTPAFEADAIEKIWSRNFSGIEINSIPHFYFQGGLNYGKMGFIDLMMMKTAAKFMSRKKDKSNFETSFEQAVQSSYDASSKENIMPLVEFVRSNYNISWIIRVLRRILLSMSLYVSLCLTSCYFMFVILLYLHLWYNI